MAESGAPSSGQTGAEGADPPERARSEAGGSSSVLTSLMPLFTALGTGIGLLGFVAFFGGAILWTQEDAAGLPASETIALVPKSVLLSTGAHFLVGAILVAVFSIAALWIYDEYLRERAIKDDEREAQRLEAERRHVADRLAQAEQDLASAQDVHQAAQTAVVDAARSIGDSGADASNLRSAAAQVESSAARLTGARTAADAIQGELRAVDAQAETVREHLKRRELRWRLVSLGIPLFGLELLYTWVATELELEWWTYMILLLASAATVSIILIVYAFKESFVLFAICTFLAVGLYLGFITYFRTRDAPMADPAAALVSERHPIVGYFIAQTSDRVYLGIPPSGGAPSRVVALPRSDVVALAIARPTLIRTGGAFTSARALATVLCADFNNGTADVAKTKSSSLAPICP